MATLTDEQDNPYEPPAAYLDDPRLPVPRKSWMRFIPAVACVYFGAGGIVVFGIVMWNLLFLAQRVGLISVLGTLTFWSGLIPAPVAVGLILTARLWVRGQYRKALLLSLALLIAFKVSGELMKLDIRARRANLRVYSVPSRMLELPRQPRPSHS